MFDPHSEEAVSAMAVFGGACFVVFLIMSGLSDDPLGACKAGGLLTLALTVLLLATTPGEGNGVRRIAHAARLIAGRGEAVRAEETPRIWCASWMAALSAGLWALAALIPAGG